MAAVSTSPPPTSPSPTAGRKGPSQLPNLTPVPQGGAMPSRHPLVAPKVDPNGAARLRDAPVSPVRVNFQRADWAEPSSVGIEQTVSSEDHFTLVDRTRGNHSSTASDSAPRLVLGDMSFGHQSLSPLDTSNLPAPTSSRPELSSASSATTRNGIPSINSPTSPPGPDGQTPPAVSAKDRVLNQELYRNSRESDETTSTSQQPASTESSVATSNSSISGCNETSDCPPHADSPGSSVLDSSSGTLVAQFQYHHEPSRPPHHQARVPSGSSDQARMSKTPDILDQAGNIRRHLTPTNYFRRSSLPRPQSSYSNLSEGSRGRSPGLMPGTPGSHMRTPSAQSRRSPDVRLSSYGDLLNMPYPQQAPAPLALDNSNLRSNIGNNASLLSTQKTLDMYRQNVKKTTDASIQYSFAIFLISTAQEQGLDYADPKGTKTVSQPVRDLESPIVDNTVTNPHELVREARHILQRLANGGYPFAQYYLADGFASGMFNKGKEDYNSAFPLFVLAAKHGHAESCYRTALCYEFGWGCRKDPAKAVQFLRAAASKRHPGAMTRLGKACLLGDLGEKRYREGVKWLKLAAESADSQYNAAPYQLGCLYETGYGDDVFVDTAYAAELFTQAADLGHPEANYRMGDAYEHGKLNCPRDPALSVHFYTGAAERGHAAAMMGLCAWYMVGAPPILDKDEEEAYEWARRSAELGFVKAQYAVGYFTEMGIGCRRDILEANVWYVKAADAGDERAKQRLAIIQAAVNGEGTPMDVAPAKSGKLAKGAKDDKECVVM